MRNVSITVDDFGISPRANATMSELVQGGIIDRIAVMPHGSISPEEASHLLRSGVKIDLHLDMSEDIDPNRKLSDGVIGRGFRFLREYCFGSGRPKQVHAVWEQQIRAFETLFGRLPDGFNSHQHIHFFPPYFRVMLALAKRHGIRHVRFGRYLSGQPNLVAIILDALRGWNRKRFEKSALATSDYLISADWLPGLDFETYAMNIPKDRTAEFIFHPERENEFHFLKDIARKTSRRVGE